MGNIFSWFSWFIEERRIIINGLDAAGKTTLLYHLKLPNEQVQTIPTIGFNVESINYGNLKLTMWDLGGRDKIKPLYVHYYPNTSAVIFVVDSHDKERVFEARDEIEKMMSNEHLVNVPILVFANKVDLPNGMPVSELTEKLALHKLKQDWTIQPCCAVTREGLYEGLDWLKTHTRAVAIPK